MVKNLSEKTEYIFADYFRLVCAIGIVALHLDPFYDINEYVDFFVGSVLTRLCVPFFFLLSGFLLKDKFEDWNKIKKYVGHLTRLYIVYTILYLPVIFYENRDNGETFLENCLDFFRRFFFVGSYGQLWYFLALIFAVMFLFAVIGKLGVSEKVMIAISVILFITGLFFRVYDKPIRDIVDEIKIVALYDSVFKTTRNGLFFGAPFVYWGNLIWKKNIVVDRKKCSILFGVSLVLLAIEAVFVRNVIGARQLDMLIMMPIVSVLLVILVLSKDLDISKQRATLWCRQMSVLIFGFHLLINLIVGNVIDKMGLQINSLYNFACVLLVNIFLALLLMLGSKKEFARWIGKIFL